MGEGGGGEKIPNNIAYIADAHRAKDAREKQRVRDNKRRVEDFVSSARSLIKFMAFVQLDTNLKPTDEEAESARKVALGKSRKELERIIEDQRQATDATNLTGKEIADMEAAAAEYIKRFGKA